MEIKLDEWEIKHLNDIEEYEAQITKLYTDATKEIAKLAALVRFNPDKIFTASNYAVIKQRFDAIINRLSNDVQVVIVNGVDAQWTLANNKNSELCNVVFGKAKSHLSKAMAKRYYSNNYDALETFKIRKDGGMNLSDKIWKYMEYYREQIEMAIDVSLRDGTPSARLAKEIQQYLNDPDKLFRRVKDEHGIMHLSKNAKSYNPGQGRYRSSYKNAMRVARTETNMSYRYSDYQRWQQLDFVVGFEVRRSNNVYACDVCERLKGPYPKNFKFASWHPHCRCYVVAILKSDEEIERDNQRIMEGLDPIPYTKSANTVKNTPQGFKDYLREKADKIGSLKSNELPYWIANNRSYVAIKGVTLAS